MPQRVGEAFRLLMQLRMMTAAVSLLLLPQSQLTPRAILLVIIVVGLSWIAARRWEQLLPLLIAHPILAAVDVLLAFAVLAFGGTLGPFFLSTVITAAVAGLLYRWPGMLAVSVLQILCYYVVLGLQLEPTTNSLATFQEVFGQPAFYPLVGFAGVALRRVFDDHAAQEEARARAEALAAAAEERARLAREMHDSLAKTLRGIALAASALPLWVQRDAGRAAAEAKNIASAVEIASREARDLITGLRDDNLTRPLPEAVQHTVSAWSRAQGVSAHCHVDPAADLPLRPRYELLAILAELLTNVERHASARSVDVGLEVADDGVQLTVSDDGCGFQPGELSELASAGHYGLIGLHERAERVSGTVVVSSGLAEGTTVTVRLPHSTREAGVHQLAEAG